MKMMPIIKQALCIDNERWRGIQMKVRYTGKSDSSLTNGKVYEVISVEKTCYRIVDDTDDDFLFLPEEFEIVEE